MLNRATAGSIEVGRQASDQDDEAELVARARVDRQAFAPLYNRYLPPVYRYCFARMRSPEAAEDLTSLVFANALAALSTYRGGSFAAWLFTIARNAVSNASRRTPDHPLTDLDVIDATPTPEELAIASDEHRLLWELLEYLSADQRQVVELRLAGLSGPEIARVLGRSHTSVRSLQFRAIARLRDLIRSEEDADDR
ncbi:MAG: RNA polymerase sigma factor [Thermomicrobiales bacterium]